MLQKYKYLFLFLIPYLFSCGVSHKHCETRFEILNNREHAAFCECDEFLGNYKHEFTEWSIYKNGQNNADGYVAPMIRFCKKCGYEEKFNRSIKSILGNNNITEKEFYCEFDSYNDIKEYFLENRKDANNYLNYYGLKREFDLQNYQYKNKTTVDVYLDSKLPNFNKNPNYVSRYDNEDFLPYIHTSWNFYDEINEDNIIKKGFESGEVTFNFDCVFYPVTDFNINLEYHIERTDQFVSFIHVYNSSSLIDNFVKKFNVMDIKVKSKAYLNDEILIKYLDDNIIEYKDFIKF